MMSGIYLFYGGVASFEELFVTAIYRGTNHSARGTDHATLEFS